MNAPANTASMSELRALQHAPALMPDQRVDMFSLRGFELAQRIAKAFANSDAVPAQFRTMVEKKGKGGSTWVENPSALGNCIVAIEVAQSVGMSITAVMQQANVIEGKLSWSAQFVIAAINASGRFTPLRFQMRNLGRIKATYKEKLGWNDQKRGFDFAERTVEVDNVECVAWALPKGVQEPKITPELMREFKGQLLDLYKAYGLPVVESAPVSMKLAVEEGWYAKSGSKWQTEMRALMLQYRAGAFFGRIHAPDIVMGMGHTTEERIDMTTVDVAPDGTVTAVTTDELRRAAGATAPPPAEVVEVTQKGDVDHGDQHAPEPEQQASDKPLAFDAEAFAERLEKCGDVDTLDLMADEIRTVEGDMAQTLTDIYRRRREQLQATPAAAPAPQPQSRRRSAPPSME